MSVAPSDRGREERDHPAAPQQQIEVHPLHGSVAVAAFIIAMGAIICVFLSIYFSPYQSCVREFSQNWCATALGGRAN